MVKPTDRTLVTLDWETFYSKDFQLRKLTTEQYVRDPRFQVIGVGVKVGAEPSEWLEHAEFLEWVKTVDWSRVAVLAHNTTFDGFILAHHYGVIPAFYYDTLSMAHALHSGVEVGGSLKALAEHYGLPPKGDEVLNALGKRREDFTPEEWLRYGAYCNNDVEITYGLFHKMLARGFPDIELEAIDFTIRAFCVPTLRTDDPRLEAFVASERERKAELLERIGADKATLMSNDKFAALLQEMGVDPPRKKSPKKKDPETGEAVETWAFAKSDPGMQGLLEHEDENVRWVCEARVGVKSTINETRAERLLHMGRRGPVPVQLKYHGAHTGRFSGAGKMNFQNFPRGGEIRKSLLAPPGHVLVVADSTAIEARILAWFAGHDSLVAGFRDNRDIYSELASVVYRRPVDRKKNKADFIPGAVGKAGVLGCGYSLGWGKFAGVLAAGPFGAPPVIFTQADADALGVDVERFKAGKTGKRRNATIVEKMPSRIPLAERMVHCAVSAHVVYTYRDANEPIVALWADMDTVLRMMLAGRETEFGPGGCVRVVQNGLVMPTGLVMQYPGLDCSDEGRFSYLNSEKRRGGERKDLYGGLMTENVVQRLARDVLVEQVSAIRNKYGYHLVTTTHDEALFCVPEAEGERALARVLEEMRTAPKWAAGLPLNAEGDFGPCYGDLK